MRLLFVHQNFPAQFGHIARHLVSALGWRCAFASQTAPGDVQGIQKIQYRIEGGATRHNHYCSRTFENAIWHCDGVHRALRARPDIQPDLIVGHSGFGSTLFLRDLYGDVPIINFFEYYYRPRDPLSDMTYRTDLGWPVPPANFMRARARNAMILLDLQNCDGAYTPTLFQKSRFPAEYQDKLRVIFDGVDRSVYHGHEERLRPPPGLRAGRTIAGRQVGPEARIITYVSRGFESMRGFDLFMAAAQRILAECPEAVIFIVGEDRIAYGGDETYIKPHKSFKDWVLSRGTFDLSRIVFTGRLPTDALGRLLAASDLHIYLTVPFVLSWSMMDAMSCGAVVLASATPPVQEMIRDGENGLLIDFFDTDGLARKAIAALKDPASFRPLGRAAERMIVERYSLEAVLPQMLALYQDVVSKAPRGQRLPPPQDDPPPASPFLA